MIPQVGAGVCTDTVASVCVGNATQLMDPQLQTLAQYQTDPKSDYPRVYGCKVNFSGAPSTSETQPPVPVPEVDSTDTTSSSNTSAGFNQTNYIMLER